MYFLTSKAATPLALFLYYFSILVTGQQLPYQPCPLLRAYYPPPTLDKVSDAIQQTSQQLSALYDRLVESSGSDRFGKITPNTTSFSVVLFSNVDYAVGDPVFFEFHHTAPEASVHDNVTIDTKFPLGTLTQLFTVYTWLAEIGDREWETPITKFLPELAASNSSDTLAVSWDDITIGSLAGQLSGLARDSFACELGKACDYQAFVHKFARSIPIFLPDTTPIISNSAFQLLAFALARNRGSNCNGTGFSDVLSSAVLQPINMTQSGLLDENNTEIFARGINSSDVGEPAALSMISTTRDLARAGHAMLTSRLVSPAITRRWLQPVADTSNLRNGVGRPWEIYHSGQYDNSSILDVFTKSGELAHYSSYFGLAPDLSVGFAILAHDTTVQPDLNAYVDVASLAIESLQKFALREAAARYAGRFVDGDNVAVFNLSSDDPGLIVPVLQIGGVDLRAEVAKATSIALENLDFRVYPTNVSKGTLHQFVAVFQDKSAPVDEDTPTCITWQDIDSLGPHVDERFLFQLGQDGTAKRVVVPVAGATLSKA